MTSPVTEYELSDIRSEMEASRPERVRVLRYASDKTDPEGATQTWTPDDTTVSGSLATSGLSATERVIASKIQEAATWVITLPYDASVLTGDRLQFETIDSVPISPSRVFDVQYASRESHQWNQRILAIEIPPDEIG